jgi:hypothetical protein
MVSYDSLCVGVDRVEMAQDNDELTTALPTSSLDQRIEQAMLKVGIVVEKFVAAAGKVAQWVQANREAIDKWAQVLKYYEAELSNLDITKQEAVTTLRQYKWILTPWTFPILISIPIAKIGKSAGDQSSEIDHLFVKHFTGNNFEPLAEMVERWAETPIFESRIHIFRDCLETLRYANANYNPCNIVIPTLVSQADGVIVEFMLKNGLILLNPASGVWQDPISGKHYKGAAQKKEFFRDESYSATMALSTELKDLAVETIFDYLFERSWTTQPAPSDFNRNKILHGEATDYGSLPNAIRAFLILDFLAILCLKFE